jgi:hypothetical protein
MPTLGTQNISTSYPQLLKTLGIGGLDGTLQVITDGDNTSSALSVSTVGVASTGTFEVVGTSLLTGEVTFGTSFTASTGTATIGAAVIGATTFTTGFTSSTGTNTLGTASISTASIAEATISTATIGTVWRNRIHHWLYFFDRYKHARHFRNWRNYLYHWLYLVYWYKHPWHNRLYHLYQYWRRHDWHAPSRGEWSEADCGYLRHGCVYLVYSGGA